MPQVKRFIRPHEEQREDRLPGFAKQEIGQDVSRVCNQSGNNCTLFGYSYKRQRINVGKASRDDPTDRAMRLSAEG